MRCNLEIGCYFIIWTFSVLYSIYCFSTSAKYYFYNYIDEYNDFTEETLLSIRRDKSDLEWESIEYFLRNFLPWILVYVGIAEICRRFVLSKEALQVWQVSFTLIYVLLVLGYIPLFLLLLQPVFFFIIKCLGPEKIYTWICSGVSIGFLNIYKSLNSEQELEVLGLNEYESYLLTMALFWMNLKCTSFFLEEPKLYSSLEFFSYSLYSPTFFTGPCILFSDFQCHYLKGSHGELRKLAKNILSVLFWFVFVNICLHFIYVNASSLQPELIKSLGSWSLYGYGYTMGQFFHLKYVVLYGLSTSIASFENIAVPNLPRCIGRIHLYSDMWKYFDPGLHKFLLRHIYIPSIKIFDNKLLASLLCFCFVYVWHGLEQHILIWAALNFLGIMMESYIWPRHIKNVPSSEYWTRQTNCLVAAPLLAVSATSSFYFFAGKQIGDVFFNRLFTDKLENTFILLLILYCCCQVSTHLRTINARKM